MKSNRHILIDGGHALNGHVEVNGSKNSVLALIPALCIGTGVGTISKAPAISDIDAMSGILSQLSVDVSMIGNDIRISGDLKYNELTPEFVSKIRASNLFLGVLLSKFGKAEVPISGGDKIGDRPMDIHFYVFDKFGITSEISNGYIKCKATKFPYEGQTIFLRYPSVGATENALLIASGATSATTIYNAAMEPEIIDMAILLNEMGVSVIGAGTPILKIKPGSAKRVEHEVIPDRLDAGTFLLSIASTGGKGVIHNVIPEHLISIIFLLKDSGVKIDYDEKNLFVDATSIKEFKAVNVNAMPYPGFPTDLQPFMAVYASICEGSSSIVDTVHRERFSHMYELRRMGLVFEHMYDKVNIAGVQELAGAEVEGLDIRMTGALILGALVATGTSKVFGVSHIERGYDNLVERLSGLGAEIKIVSE